jgi:hypothetical protein
METYGYAPVREEAGVGRVPPAQKISGCFANDRKCSSIKITQNVLNVNGLRTANKVRGLILKLVTPSKMYQHRYETLALYSKLTLQGQRVKVAVINLILTPANCDNGEQIFLTLSRAQKWLIPLLHKEQCLLRYFVSVTEFIYCRMRYGTIIVNNNKDGGIQIKSF